MVLNWNTAFQLKVLLSRAIAKTQLANQKDIYFARSNRTTFKEGKNWTCTPVLQRRIRKLIRKIVENGMLKIPLIRTSLNISTSTEFPAVCFACWDIIDRVTSEFERRTVFTAPVSSRNCRCGCCAKTTRVSAMGGSRDSRSPTTRSC